MFRRSHYFQFYHRRVERNKTKLHRIKQLEQCKSNDEKLTKDKAHSTVRELRINVNKHEERIENIQKRMDELKQMMLNIQNEQNKESESYLNVSLIPTDHSQRQRVPRRVIRTKTRNRGNGDKNLHAISI